MRGYEDIRLQRMHASVRECRVASVAYHRESCIRGHYDLNTENAKERRVFKQSYGRLLLLVKVCSLYSSLRLGVQPSFRFLFRAIQEKL